MRVSAAAARGRRVRLPQPAPAALVAVGVLFLVLQQVLRAGPRGLTIDEADYLAMVDPAVPELYWTQVRAWGMPVLAAPVAVFSAGTGTVRLYFSALSSAGLVAAFWPWLRVLHPAVAPLAALLFATTWFTLSFGSQVMPNLYVALGSVAATGLFLQAVRTGRRAGAAATGAAAGLVALVRPSDSLLLLAGVFACALVLPRLRRPRLLAAIAVGAALGWLPWVVEAYLRFGGPLARLQGGNEAGLKGGLTLSLTNAQTFLRLLDGRPTYCCYGGPAAEAGPVPPSFAAWCLAVGLLALLGVVAAARQGTLPETVLPAVVACVFAGFYLLLLSFGAARFLLPITALLCLPVAAGLVAPVASARGRRRSAAGLLVGVVVVGHLGLMLPVAAAEFRAGDGRQTNVRLARAVRPFLPARPCVVVGVDPQVRSYYLGCTPQQLRPVTSQPPQAVRDALAQGGSVVAVLSGPVPRGSYLASWRPVPLRGPVRGWTAYLPPGSPRG